MASGLDISPALDRLSRRWYTVVGGGILGGVAGLIFSLARPPIYESFAILSIGLNPDRAQPLTLYDLDLAMGKAAGVVAADTTWSAALLAVGATDTPASDPQSRNNSSAVSHWLARKGTRWEFRVSSLDGGIAAELANAWAAEAEQVLAETRHHAIEANGAQAQLDALLPELAAAKAEQAGGEEERDRLAALELTAGELQIQIESELVAARGVVSFLSSDLTEIAQLSQSPSTRGRGQLLLAGSGLGAALSIALIVFLPAGSAGASSPPKEEAA